MSEQPLTTTAAERIAAIIDAVEKAASGVIDDAEAEARQYLEASRRRSDRIAAARLAAVEELTADLVVQAQELQRRSRSLIAAFDAAEKAVAADPPSPAPAERQPTPAGQDPDSSAGVPSGNGPEPVAADDMAGTRLLVTQMAITGSSRSEISRRLRDDLGIDDSGAMLDSILGPER